MVILAENGDEDDPLKVYYSIAVSKFVNLSHLFDSAKVLPEKSKNNIASLSARSFSLQNSKGTLEEWLPKLKGEAGKIRRQFP